MHFSVQACDWQAVDVIFTYHGKDTLPHRLAILANFPETFSPFDYRSLLPTVRFVCYNLYEEYDQWFVIVHVNDVIFLIISVQVTIWRFGRNVDGEKMIGVRKTIVGKINMSYFYYYLSEKNILLLFASFFTRDALGINTEDVGAFVFEWSPFYKRY